MHEILRNLPAGARGLGLGCQEGSFPRGWTKATVVRLDRDAPRQCAGGFVRGDAGLLPFAEGSFAAVIANHSLEHFDDLERSEEHTSESSHANISYAVFC